MVATPSENGSLSLNIVAIPPPKDNNANLKNKKRLNKYDKRRRRAEQVKKARVPPPTWADSVVELDTKASELVESNAGNKKSAERNDYRSIIDQSNDKSDCDSCVEDLSSERKTDEIDHSNDEDNSENDIPVDIGDSNNAASDEQALADRADVLQDEASRAKYLAEFHARPLELDRRAGASSKHRIQSSHNSKHLFSEATEWVNMPLHERLIASMSQFKFDRPTIVQSEAITAFAEENQLYNLLLQAETGSGKTLAYLLPILQSLAVDSQGVVQRLDRSQCGTRCIILCPTRELASQTFGVVEQLCAASFNWLVPGCLFGEERRKSEKARLRKGLAIVVATPGRLLDHLSRTESLLLSLKGKLQWLVLDEADRLLDMGLGDQVKQIVQHVRANQPGSGRNGITWRSVLVSATVTPHVETLAKEILIGGNSSWRWIQTGESKSFSDPTVASSTDDQAHSGVESEFSQSTPQQLTQQHMTVSAKLRLPALVAFLVLRAAKKERTVVFLSTCAAVDYYHALFAKADTTSNKNQALFGQECSFYKLHGSIPHTERQQTLKNFFKVSSTKLQAAVLFATDVASRGLNLPDIDWTVQYDPPAEVAEYVHRAGRVARAGRSGHSLLFLLPSERSFLDILKKRGVKRMSPLSLSSTLNAAANIRKVITADGARRSGGVVTAGTSSVASSRLGEAFALEVQQRLETLVTSDEAKAKGSLSGKSKGERRTKPPEPSKINLMEMARHAFVSHIRAYPTREKLVRHVFTSKALHLGHVARSFALKEPPKKLATMASKETAAVLEKSESRKRNRSMAFPSLDLEDVRDRTAEGNGNAKMTRSAKSILLSNATKLQQVGMASF